VRRYAAPLALAAAFTVYVAVYVVAAALGLPPAAVWQAIFQALGFTVGAVALFAVVLQLIRR